jgi:hypothetical protein
MLQGGRKIADIAVLWPITAIQGETYINRDATSGLPVANWVPEKVIHYQLSELLTNQIRRDFTYIHPEMLCNGKITINGNELRLNNTTNIQDYKVLIIPGGDVISAETLKAIKKFYEAGGKVIAAASLPTRSAEFGRDEEIKGIITEIMGDQTEKVSPSTTLIRTNEKGGMFGFLPEASKETLTELLNRMNVLPDLSFDESQLSPAGLGYFNYLHKQKEGRDIYFITNTTDKDQSTTLQIRGDFRKMEYWNPYSGAIETIAGTKINRGTEVYTETSIALPAVSSLFIVGYKK